MARSRRIQFLKLVPILVWIGMASACQRVPGGVDETVSLMSPSVRPVPAVTVHLVSALPASNPASRQVSYVNIEEAARIAVDQSGNIWTAGRGGVVRWDARSKTTQGFTSSDGLPGNFITALAIAPDNKIWVGTYAGAIAEYDGNAWVTIDKKPGDIINCLAIAPDGAVWVGTNRGVNRFDGKRWQAYSVEQGLPDATIHSIAVSSTGTVWAGVMGGAAFFDGKTWHAELLEKGEFISAIVEAPDKTVWFGSDKALIHFDGHQWRAFLTNGSLGGISGMAISPKGELWLTGSGSGLARFDQDLLRFTEYPIPDTASLAFDAGGGLWLGSQAAGIYHFDGTVLEGYQAADEPVGNLVLASASAPDGSLWFGTDQGATRFDGTAWKSYTTADGLGNNNILCMAATAYGSMWFGTENGVSVFNGVSWKNYGTADGLTKAHITGLTPGPGGTVWAVSPKGLFQFNAGQWNVVMVPNFTADDSFESIATGPDGGIWVASTGGLTRYDGQNWISINLPTPQPVLHVVQTNTRDTWIETKGSALIVIDGGVWDQIASAGIQAITLDEAGLIHATNDSREVSLKGVLWHSYAPGNGLPGKTLLAYAARRDGGAWVVTDQGLFSVSGNRWASHSGPIAWGAEELNSLTADRQGALWVSMPLGGIVKYVP